MHKSNDASIQHMVVSQKDIQACRHCGNVYSEISRRNPMRCPICGHAEGEDIIGIHY